MADPIAERKSDLPPAFLLYPRDLLASGKVQRMSLEELGAYVKLLCRSYLAGGWLSSDPEALADALGTDANTAEQLFNGIVSRCFVFEGDRFASARLLEEIDRQAKRRQLKAEAGRKSGAARRAKSKTSNSRSVSFEQTANSDEQTANKREPTKPIQVLSEKTKTWSGARAPAGQSDVPEPPEPAKADPDRSHGVSISDLQNPELAIEAGFKLSGVPRTEANRQNILAARIRAINGEWRDRCAYFAWFCRGRFWSYLTAGDEKAAELDRLESGRRRADRLPGGERNGSKAAIGGGEASSGSNPDPEGLSGDSRRSDSGGRAGLQRQLARVRDQIGYNVNQENALREEES